MARSSSDSTSLTAHQQFNLNRRKLLVLVIFIVALYGIIPELGRFSSTLKVAEQAHLNWLILGLGFSVLSSLAATSIYLCLAQKKLHFSRTLLVQLAGLFANRLLPAGVGALGVNYEYLRRQKHTKTQAASVVAANNGLGLTGHLLLLIAVLVIAPSSLSRLFLPHLSHTELWLVGLVLVTVVTVLVWFQKLRQELYHSIISLAKQLINYRSRPLRLGLALGLSMTLTACYAACLLVCGRAFGVSLNPAQTFLVLTLGVAGGTVVPTPGGLGGTEAGLVAGLLSYHVPGAEALATVLGYRLLTYWLPLIIGGPVFIFSRRRGYI